MTFLVARIQVAADQAVTSAVVALAGAVEWALRHTTATRYETEPAYTAETSALSSSAAEQLSSHPGTLCPSGREDNLPTDVISVVAEAIWRADPLSTFSDDPAVQFNDECNAWHYRRLAQAAYLKLNHLGRLK